MDGTVAIPLALFVDILIAAAGLAVGFLAGRQYQRGRAQGWEKEQIIDDAKAKAAAELEAQIKALTDKLRGL